MVQISNWPPTFDRPPPPAPNILTSSEDLSNQNFILQCIRKGQLNVSTNRQKGSLTDITNSYSDGDSRNQASAKRTKMMDGQQNTNKKLFIPGILRNNNASASQHQCQSNLIVSKSCQDHWTNFTLQNNERNAKHQDRWRVSLAFPIDLSKNTRSQFHHAINDNWNARYGLISPDLRSALSVSGPAIRSQKIRFLDAVSTSFAKPNGYQTSAFPSEDKENIISHRKKRPLDNHTNMISNDARAKPQLLINMQNNLISRAERKITRIATWNINNGFDHLAIASIMAKKDIDILALQEPRISHSTTDDVWIATMRKELRKCKYEIITSQFSYIIFDEQTSGAALASIIRQVSKVQGRLLSVTFKSNDIWEVHTVISIYAVTNAKSSKKYAKSHSSRKDVNSKLTKALDDEIRYLAETFGEAPITIVGDYQDTIHTDQRDNIGLVGRKTNPGGPLQLLLNLGFQSAYHLKYPNQQQVTRWNGSRTAGRHIDLQMVNDSAESLLLNVTIDDDDVRNHITSDHLVVMADYHIEKVKQDIIDCYRTKINFRKVAGIKMKLQRKQARCQLTAADITSYHVDFDQSQFMSSMVQDQFKMLDKWQQAAESNDLISIMSTLEYSMKALEEDVSKEDAIFNEMFDPTTSNVQRKLVERNLERRAHLDSIYNIFQKAIFQIAASIKIVSTENKHVDSLCTRQLLKMGKTKRYGDNIINLISPTSNIRSALGDLKNAEAILRNLNHSSMNSGVTQADRNLFTQRSFKSLSKNVASFQMLKEASAQLLQRQEENIDNENAVSSHRKLDAFSGRWEECQFNSGICKNLISQTNAILQQHNVRQRVGMRQLDQSTTAHDQWTDLTSWWNGPDLSTLASTPDLDINNPEIAEAIQRALVTTRKLKKRAMATLIQNKEKLLAHASRMNHTSLISQRLNPKIMDEPEAHHVLLDPSNIHASSNIRCSSFQQCLDNTLLYHQNWMDRSGSTWEHHWFKTTTKYGHINGISFNFSGKPTDAEFQRLVARHQDCSASIRKAFQDAHSDAIANVMQPPCHPHRAFDWIWHPSSSDDDWSTFVDNYWKAISSVPGKARYNGYTIHLRMTKMMMILRILPEKTKTQARVPIPKPKPGETRPLSLINDDMCFILGFLTKHFALKCEEVSLIPPTLHAYRRGMSTSFITLIDLAMREDAISFGRYMALTAEDEEKFFDRVSLEVQLAVLVILGFPLEGLLEMKAEEMDNITVEIHTRHGLVIGKFLHGFKQGSPLSCISSNMVLVFKHRVWGLRDPLSKPNDPNGYTMTVWNKSIDGNTPPIVSMEGFCDDNSKWNMGDGIDFASMVQAIQWNIKLAGDLSMIFKIGRRGDKTIIELFNVDLHDIFFLPANGFTSIAWDFKANRPTEEEVDCRVYLKRGQVLPEVKPESITDSVWKMLIKGTSLKSERSLGIWRNKFGDTSDSADKRAFLFGNRIDRLNLSNLKNDKIIKHAINSLVVPVYQFGILENKCCPEVFEKMDSVLINKIRKAIGFAWCDAKQLIFVPEEKFGMGIRSVSVEMLKSICRELEVHLNDDELLGKVLRGRLEAFKHASNLNARHTSFATYDDINQGVRNFIMEAIRHIAQYGFYIRDLSDTKLTYQVEAAIILAQEGSLFNSFQHNTLGMYDFTGTGSKAGTTLGSGDLKLLWSTIYGRCHTLLDGKANHSRVKMNFTMTQIMDIKSKAMALLHDDIRALYTVHEWSEGNIGPLPPGISNAQASIIQYYESSINNTKHWRRFSALSAIQQPGMNDDSTDNDTSSHLDGLLIHDRSELLSRIYSEYIQPNRLRYSDIDTLLQDGWPLIVATDGGAGKVACIDSSSPHNGASASVVIFKPPSIPFVQYITMSEMDQANYLQQNLMPWKARATSLPIKIGDHLIDNAHAECFALILMEEWLPLHFPVILLMDSEAERERYLHLQAMHHKTNRFLIRSLMSGVSKCLGSRLAYAIHQHQNQDENSRFLSASNIEAFCLHAKSWCYTTTGEQSLWALTQWNPGQLRTVWAVRSHQLNSDLSVSPKNRYGNQIVPNRALVSANQWADNVCNAIMRFKRNAVNSSAFHEIRKWCPPVVSIGITGPKFIITFNGVALDRCVCSAVEEACTNEFMRRLAQRPTQGMLIRLHKDLYIKPAMIGRHSYHRRLLEGKTKTHTRAMYTDTDYRKAIVSTYAKHEEWADDAVKFQLALKDATKNYKFLRCPFCVTQCAQNEQHLFLPHATTNSGLFGNSRHFGFYCLNESIMAVRHQMNQLLEDHLTELFRIASNWGRQGFATLLNRATSAITKLDRSTFHNAQSSTPSYVKSEPESFACLTATDWMPFLESQSDHVESLAKKLFFHWPLVHQLGFITANSYTLLEMHDGTYSPCDMIPLGIIPLALQDVILQFAMELGVRHSSDTKKDFLLQWQQIRAVALLRAISTAMVTGAQISEHKTKLLNELSSTSTSESTKDIPMIVKLNDADNSISEPNSSKRGYNKITSETNIDQYPCEGITCSTLFTATTTLRSSLMRSKGRSCRRCLNITRAMDCAVNIEQSLAENLESFRTFQDSINASDNITIDDIVDAISKINPLPASVLPTYFKRATKRNVYPITMMNTVRLLNGTFKWYNSGKPTSIDSTFNQTLTTIEGHKSMQRCKCRGTKLFFAVDISEKCPSCNGVSSFSCTSARISIAKAINIKRLASKDNFLMTDKTQHFRKNSAKSYQSKKNRSKDVPHEKNVLKDITNLSKLSNTSLPCTSGRPANAVLEEIAHVNNMLSNFVITYFFMILARRFTNILYKEFLFDFVKREGGWKQFVQYCRREGNYTQFLASLSQQQYICLVPICCDAHWTLLVRRFIGNSWKILFLDSMTQGSDLRFNAWKQLFSDNELFSGEWIKVKILQQTELECGARVCVHGVCFALSTKKCTDIIKDLSRFRDLSVRSRLMVSHICIDGYWSDQKWLQRTIGNAEGTNT